MGSYRCIKQIQSEQEKTGLAAPMNRYTFGDAGSGRREALSNELAADGDSDQEDERAGRNNAQFEGEEAMDREVEKFDEAGVEIDAFNLQNEREGGGHFDASGNYVFRKDKDEEDAWMTAMDEADMEKNIGEAAAAKMKRDAMLYRKADLEETKEAASIDILSKRIIGYGESREVVSDAIQRLSSTTRGIANGSKPVFANKRERKTDSGVGKNAAAIPQKSKAEIAADKKRMLELIELADQLLSGGMVSIYSMTFEAIRNSLFEWEYKGADGSVYGPFSCIDIAKWKKGGYFTGTKSVMMRPCRNIAPVSGKKRQVGFTSTGEEPATKRVKTGNEDLLGDLDSGSDDESIEEEKDNGTQQQKQVNEEEEEESIISFEWRLSDSIDFGPADAQMAPAASTSTQRDGDDNYDDGFASKGERRGRGSTLRDDGADSD